MEHQFTQKILEVLEDQFGKTGENLYRASELLRYLNEKTRSASRGSRWFPPATWVSCGPPSEPWRG